MARTRKHFLEFASLHITAGEHELADLFFEVVLPAIQSKKHKFGKTTYQFLEPAIAKFDKEYVLIAEFAKDTKIESEQVLTNGRMKRRSASLDDTPSAFVVLVLETHRLVFLPKTPRAPNLRQLEASLREMIRSQNRERSEMLRKAKKESASFLQPECTIIPLSTTESVAEGLRDFARIDNLVVEFMRVNADYSPKSLFRNIQQAGESLGANKTTLRSSAGGGKDSKGLDKERVAEAVKGASGTGRPTVRGVDAEGQVLTQRDDELQVREEAPFTVSSVQEAAPKMLESLQKKEANETFAKPTRTRWASTSGELKAAAARGPDE